MTKRKKYQGIEIYDKDPSYITEFSKTLLDGYYKRADESISEALSRPATAFCYGDYGLAQRIYDYAYKGWFMYASPVLSNATKGVWVASAGKNSLGGNVEFVAQEKVRGQPISCFAFDVPDTAQGQVEAIQELATLSMSGGGTGAHLSIRGVGGKAVGNIPYQKMMDSAIGYFRQENRRGAIASYLDVTHPDIIEHINFRKPGGDTKRRSDNRQQYHTAVNITDKFIDAVINDKDYDLVCPHSGKVYDTLKGRAVWELILDNRALTGEPFLLKIDEANRKMPETQKAKGLKIRGSNLCVAPETLILTRNGHKAIEGCVGNIDIWNGQEWSNVEVAKTGVNQKLLKVTTKDGFSLDCTPQHKFYVVTRPESTNITRVVDAKDLKSGDKLIKFDLPIINGDKTLKHAYANGFYSGDGCFVGDRQRLYFYGEKRKLKERCGDIFQGSWTVQDNQDREYGHTKLLKEKFFVPNSDYTIETRLDWLAGLLDSDGTVSFNGKTQSYQIGNIEHEFLKSTQFMLQTLGVKSKVTKNKDAGFRMLPANDGTGEKKEYYCQTAYRLLISNDGLSKLRCLGLRLDRLITTDHNPNRECSQFIKVESVEDLGRVSDTYCFTEPKRGMGMFNGILTGQCSEILMPTDENRTFVCCLSSLNLEKFEEWKDTTIVEDLTRFLDNTLQSFIDNAPDTLFRAKYSATMERGLGLGTLGFHAYLQSKGIPIEGGGFGSSIQHTNMLYKLIKDRAVEESKQLAVERGEPDDMKGTGLRNSRLMAVAPNANSADLLDTSPSIEPYFRNVFIKSTRAGNFKVKNKHLEKLLILHDKNTDEVWDEINKNNGSVSNLDFLSDHDKRVFATAMEIDQHWLIEIAEHRGKYVCQSSSLNVFFPFGSSRKYVNSVHLKFLKSENVLTMYYMRNEREGKVDNVKAIERKALIDWSEGQECISCSG